MLLSRGCEEPGRHGHPCPVLQPARNQGKTLVEQPIPTMWEHVCHVAYVEFSFWALSWV